MSSASRVLKGSAPVMYGATSFVGVVQVLHYPAGQSTQQIDLAGGSYGSARGDLSMVLPGTDTFRNSLAVDGQSIGFADKRENISDGQLLYRAADDIGPGTLRFDADLTFVHDAPPSPILRNGTGLTPLIPINANFNPANAEISENKHQGEIGWTQPVSLGTWDTLLSYAHSDIVYIAGFLHPDLSGTVDTQDQHRLINDGYFDTHITNTQFEHLTLTAGADMLYGYGRQGTYNDNSAYTVPLNGSVLPPLLRRREQRECGRQRAPDLAAYPGLGRHPVFTRAGFQWHDRRELYRSALSRRREHGARWRICGAGRDGRVSHRPLSGFP
jgi:iron complex outermembrane receptor protein